MKRWNAISKAAAVAVVLATAAFLWLALWPHFYHGVATSAADPGTPSQAAQPVTREFTRSLVQVNGVKIIPALLLPVMLTVVGLLITLWADTRQRWNRVMLWVNAGVLTAFSFLALASIGLFYIPSAIGLLTAAMLAQAYDPAAVHRPVRRRQRKGS